MKMKKLEINDFEEKKPIKTYIQRDFIEEHISLLINDIDELQEQYEVNLKKIDNFKKAISEIIKENAEILEDIKNAKAALKKFEGLR